MLGDCSEDLQHHRAGGRVGVEAHPKDAEAAALCFHAVHDLDQVAHRASQAIELRADEDVVFAEVVEGRLELVALGDAADLLGEDLGAASGLQVSDLGIEASDLVVGGGACVSDKHSATSASTS